MIYKEANLFKGSVEPGKGLTIMYFRMNTQNYSKQQCMQPQDITPTGIGYRQKIQKPNTAKAT